MWYLVVFRLNDADCMQRVQHWLRTIAQFARDPRRATKVVVVATHTDAVQSRAEQEGVWAQVRPVLSTTSCHVTATVSVSCSTGAGFKELQAALLVAMDTGQFGSQTVPLAYLQVWKGILQRRTAEPKMDVNAFAARFPELNKAQVMGACRFLMDAGMCFFNEGLDLVVLSVQWLADVFKEVVSFYSGVKDGVVTLLGLRHSAWKGLPAAEIRQYMRLLEKFEMAFPRLQEDSWVVPCMLKEGPALLQPKCDNALWLSERIFELDLMPAGVVGRLMVRLQSHPRLHVSLFFCLELRFTHSPVCEGWNRSSRCGVMGWFSRLAVAAK